jgi:hypothetical protein
MTILTDTIDQEHIALRILCTLGKDGLIGGRRVPAAGSLTIREGDDQISWKVAFQFFFLATMDDEASLKRCECGVDDFESGDSIRPHLDIAKMADGIAGHF